MDATQSAASEKTLRWDKLGSLLRGSRGTQLHSTSNTHSQPGPELCCLAVRVAGAAEVAQLGAWLAVRVAGAAEVAQLGAWLAVRVAGAVQLSTPAASE